MGKKVIATYIAKVGYATTSPYKGKKYKFLRVGIPKRIAKKIGLSIGDYVKVSIEKIEITEIVEK